MANKLEGMEKLNTEGIVINAIPFRNYDCILTLFTPLDGLVKFFVRGAYSSKKGGGSGITPLSVVEVTYTKGRSDLYSCTEIAVINHHLSLRHNLGILEAACEMLRALSITQQPGKAAPELYQLLLMYLQKLPHFVLPQIISNSFKLKLLRYEGLLAFLSHCSVCAQLLGDGNAWIYENEAYCSLHTPSKALSLAKEERAVVDVLAFCRDFALLAKMNISVLLCQKIHKLFEGCLSE
jgi:DNA repair protein RecO (recombination protein O)